MPVLEVIFSIGIFTMNKLIGKLLLISIFWATIGLLVLSSCSSSPSPGTGGSPNQNGTSGFSTVFVGTATGVFRSIDSGRTWQSLPGSPTMIQNGQAGGFAAIGSSLLATNGLPYLSTDNGDHWKQLSIMTERVTSVAAFHGLFIAGCANGIFWSSDQGNTWQMIDPVYQNESYIFGFSQSQDNLYAIDGYGVLRSSDGKSWQFLASLHYGLSIEAGVENIFAGTDVGSNPDLFRSTDSGTTWNPVSNGYNFGQVWSLSAIGSAIFAATDIGLYRSDNAGALWTLMGMGYPVDSLEFNSVQCAGSFIFAASPQHGVFVSSDEGNTWSHSTVGLNDSAAYTIGLQ